jgi:hypothetical protein
MHRRLVEGCSIDAGFKVARQVCLLTVHAHGNTPDETVADFESFSCGGLGLLLRELVEPLQGCFDLLLSFLYEYDCLA